MNARTRQDVIALSKPQTVCPLCKLSVSLMVIHLATDHKGVEQCGEIFWLNKHEAVYKGKRYVK